MTDENKQRAEVELNYQWQNHDMSILIQATKTHLIPFIGESFSFNGYIEQEGPFRIKSQFDVIDDWFAALASTVSEIHLRLYSITSDRKVNIYFDPRKKHLSGSIEAPYQELQQIKSLIQQLEGDMLRGQAK